MNNPRLPMPTYLVRLIVLKVFLLGCFPLHAQWSAQTLTLRPGWNAVFLEVQPEPRECDAVLAGLPVESVWRFNRRQTSVQFIEDPAQLVIGRPDWLVWFPAAHPLKGLNQLFTIDGGRPYLFKLADSASITNWTLRGVPVLRQPDWLASSLNFVGFSLPAETPPLIQSFFADSPALAGGAVYRLNTTGRWSQVPNPAVTRIQRGEAFWVRSTGLPDFTGPLQLQLDRRSGLDFGRTLTEQTLRVHNPSPNQSRTVTLRLLTSENIPVSAGLPVKAGPVPLSWWQNDFVQGNVGWAHLTTTPLVSNVPPRSTWELRLAVRRADMTPFVLPSGATEATFQSLIEVSDAGNLTRLLVPVAAAGLDGQITSARSLAGAQPARPLHAGLWVGTVTLTNVSHPAATSPLEPLPTASPFEFRLIVHVDKSGQTRLLQRSLLLWRPGETNTSGGVAIPGRYVLVTDEHRTNGLVGATLRDGKLVGRRFSSAAFTLREPLPLNPLGAFGIVGNQLLGTVTNRYDAALNPFVHRFHPDHNNLNDRGESLEVHTNHPAGPYTQESWTVTRHLELGFSAAAPDGLALAGWGDTQVGGSYRERLAGLHASDLVVQGYFRLHQAARVAVLDDGQ